MLHGLDLSPGRTHCGVHVKHAAPGFMMSTTSRLMLIGVPLVVQLAVAAGAATPKMGSLPRLACLAAC
eukprot:8364699-Karenia_brevis.AAC.1